MTTFFRHATSHTVLWVIVAVFALGSVAYLMGYRLDGNGFSKVGTVVLRDLPPDTALYLDGTSRIVATAGAASATLAPGVHEIIVDAQGHQPWSERFEVRSGETVSLAPLLFRNEINARELGGDDAQRARTALSTMTLPTKVAPLTVAGGCVRVYAFGNRILAEGTTTPECVLPSYLECAPQSAENPTGTCATTIVRTDQAPVRAIIPFPGRDDALVAMAGDAVYALELDPREPQQYSLLFRGPATGLTSWSDTSVAISAFATKTLYIELPL